MINLGEWFKDLIKFFWATLTVELNAIKHLPYQFINESQIKILTKRLRIFRIKDRCGRYLFWIFLFVTTESVLHHMAIIVVTGSAGSRRDPTASALANDAAPDEKDSGCDPCDLWMLSPSAASVLYGHLPISSIQVSRFQTNS